MPASGIPAGMNAKLAGSKHFTRFLGGKPDRTVGFDSSPDFSLSKKFGLGSAPLEYELVPEECNTRYNTWRVYTPGGSGSSRNLAGVLREKTTQQIRDELAAR